MKVVFDLSVTSAIARSGGGAVPWDAAWASPISAAAPELVLDFAADVYGVGGVQGTLGTVVGFSRSSDATRIDESGSIDVVAPNVARLDHDPVTLAPRGLLVEAGRTNIIANSGTPLDQTVSVTATPHVISFYGGGTVTLSGAHDAVIVGSGSYPNRTSLSFTPVAGDIAITFTGDVQAPQLEPGTSVSSYIPTGGAPFARAEDIATVPLGSWFNASEGTLVFSGTLDNAQANDRILEIDAGSTGTRMSLLWNTVLSKPQFQVWNGGSLQAAIAPPGNSIALGDHFRVAIAYGVNDFVVSLNGSSLAKDTAGDLPVGLSTMRLGRSVWGAQGLMVAEGIAYYPYRLSDAEVQALSA